MKGSRRKGSRRKGEGEFLVFVILCVVVGFLIGGCDAAAVGAGIAIGIWPLLLFLFWGAVAVAVLWVLGNLFS